MTLFFSDIALIRILVLVRSIKEDCYTADPPKYELQNPFQ